MSQLISGAKLWVDGYDFSADISSTGLEYGAEMLDATTIDKSTRINQGGLFTFGMSYQGFWRGGANQIDPTLFDSIGLANKILTLCPTTGAEGEPCLSGRMTLAQYNPGGMVGELFKFDVSAEADETPIRGTVIHFGSESGNHTGTAFNIGAVAAGESVYAALHVFSGSGNFDVIVESDSAEAFDQTPQTQITFTQVGTATARSSEWKSTAGAITDTWWRMDATNPVTRNFAVIMAIR